MAAAVDDDATKDDNTIKALVVEGRIKDKEFEGVYNYQDLRSENDGKRSDT